MVDNSLQEAFAKASAEAATRAEEAKRVAAQGVEHREGVKATQNDDYYARSAAAQPTPTQRENDLAKVGAIGLDEKEEDGSEPEGEAVRRVMESKIPGNNPYETRDMDTGESRASAKRGRPSKK